MDSHICFNTISNYLLIMYSFSFFGYGGMGVCVFGLPSIKLSCIYIYIRGLVVNELISFTVDLEILTDLAVVSIFHFSF